MSDISKNKKDAKTYTDFIQNSNACILCLLVKLEHGRGDIACSHDMLLVSNCRSDDSCVEGVWDQTDDKIMLSDRSVKSVVISDVQGDRFCQLYTC